MIVCRSDAEIDRMQAANQLVADVLASLEAAVAPGVTTEDLDRLAERLVREGGAIPAFKGYRGYPATLCASINEEVVHGIPSKTRVLKSGDIVSLDIGVKVGGFYGDSAVTVPVGTVPEATSRLLQVTRQSLERAIEPMVTMGSWEVRVLDDGWTAVTQDGSLAAHFEHTVAVTENGPEVLTSLTGQSTPLAPASRGR